MLVVVAVSLMRASTQWGGAALSSGTRPSGQDIHRRRDSVSGQSEVGPHERLLIVREVVSRLRVSPLSVRAPEDRAANLRQRIEGETPKGSMALLLLVNDAGEHLFAFGP